MHLILSLDAATAIPVTAKKKDAKAIA